MFQLGFVYRQKSRKLVRDTLCTGMKGAGERCPVYRKLVRDALYSTALL